MPLVRFEIQNEYSLGAMELYGGGGGSVNKDDPKSILDGVAVAGLVGVLRQLGDLAEFAAGIFHDLQEQVVATSSRSHKIMVRVQHMEQVLPHLEKVVFSQTEHIHFAYTAGSDWHPNHQYKENHFVNGDLPPFIMDSFEECRDSPSLHLLDKFDIGGPGACLKRYSDPSFFRRVLSTSSENTQGEKKARRSNRQRNIAAPHPMTIFQQNSRMQFTSPNISQKNSTARTNSMSRSELEDRSTSFGSRRSDYDLDFDMRSYTSDNEKEQILASSKLKMQCEDTVGSVHPCQQNGHGTDLSQQNEEKVSDSSCVTWDEKTEILKSPSQSNNINEDQKTISSLMPGICEQNKLKSEAVTIDDCSSDCVTSYDENMHESPSDGNLSDEDESESEDYMDALNTTASDIDTDAERRTKSEEVLKNYTDCGKGMLSEINSHSSTLVDVQPYMIPEAQNIFPEHLVLAKEQNIIPNNSDFPNVTHLQNVPREKSRKTSTGDSLSSDSIDLNAQTSNNEDTESSVCNPQGSLTEPSRRSSINLWTNGVLLGLEPSKPPDLNALDSANQNLLPVANTDEHDLSDRRATTCEIHLSGSTRKLDNPVVTNENSKKPVSKEVAADLPERVNFSAQDQLVNDARSSVQTIDPCAYSMSGSDKKGNFVFGDKSLNSPLRFSKAKLEESKDSIASSNFNKAFGSDLTDARVVNPGNDLQTLPDVSRSFKEINQDAKASSSSMFLPSYKLLAKSFQKKASLSHDDTVTPQLQRTVVNEANMHLKDRSRINPNASSPPLEHMKISFYPDDTSTFKLKFHDGRPILDNDKDVLLPSFQLLPESVIQLNGISFESDGDTFSRSSEYMSDELLSEISESGSDQWACKETPQCEDTDIYNALRRVSSEESISRSSEFEEGKYDSIPTDGDIRSPLTTNGISCHHGFIIDPPNETNMHIMIPIPHEPILPPPPPPPLPPLQWRTTKPQEDLVDDRQGHPSKDFSYQNIERVPVFNMPQPPEKIVPRQQLLIPESTISTPENKNHEDMKFNGQEVAEQPQTGNNIVEKEDFLHQIRSKSLSLKRTTIARPAFTSGPVSDMKVTAIIQKANAIRQAFVGSDEEDSDDWSDG